MLSGTYPCAKWEFALPFFIIFYHGGTQVELHKGLTAYQLKVIAVVFMTLDHLQRALKQTRAFELWRFSDCIWHFGRIAAPLFLFLIAESTRYTHDRHRFLLRLYFASVLTGIFNTITDIVFTICFDVTRGNPNIFFTLFFTVLHILLIEDMVASLKSRKMKRLLADLGLFMATILSVFIQIAVSEIFSGILFHNFDNKFLARVILDDLTETLFPSVLTVEYSYVFVIMGVCFYFAKNKYRKCIVFSVFCILCYLSARMNIGFLQGFYGNGDQHWMFLAIPFMLLYNGKRGKEHKTFFYVYYPTHDAILFAASQLLNRFFA